MKKILMFLAILAGCHKAPPPTPPAPSVTVVKPTVADVPRFNTYVGHLAPYMQVQVKAQVEAVLTGYYFIEGQEVNAGDLLFTLDARPYEAQLSKAEAALAASIATKRQAEETAKRNAPLAQEEYVARLQFDQYLTNVATAQAEMDQTKADIETARINISYCNIFSPINAVTGELQIDVGNLIENAGMTPLITLNQITPIYAYFSVPQSDLPEIMRLQNQNPLTVEAYLGTTPYPGTLNLIDNQVNQNTGSILMRGIFPNLTKELWAGEYVQVRVILEQLKGAILLPAVAVLMGENGPFIFVVKSDQTVELRPVVAGQRLDDQVVITSGLKADETVVLDGQINLSNGVKVTIKTGASPS